MKVGLVYTVTTPELVEFIEREVRNQLGDQFELFSLQDSGILEEIRDAGRVTAAPAARLIGLYMKAVEMGADAILNICSSVGEVADSVQTAAKFIGVPIVRVDEEMCFEAVRSGARIGVMATLPTTLNPTRNTIMRAARELGKNVELVDCLVDAYGLDQESFKAKLADAAANIIDSVDVVVLAQGSMAYAEEHLSNTFHKKFLSSPRFGALALKEALAHKGLIKS